MSASAAPTASATASAPGSVVWSYRLYLIGAVLGLIGTVLSLVLLPAAIDAAVQSANRSLQGRDTQGVDVEALARGAAIGAVVLGAVLSVIFSVLIIVFARKMLQGRNWARIVLLVFAVLQVFGVLSTYGLGALHFLVVAVAAVLSFLPVSNAWFREARTARTTTV
jgi:predicted ferric reductase